MAKPGRPHKSNPQVENCSFEIEKGENESVKEVLKEFGLDACDSFQRTALIWSAFHNNLSLLNWLIENGANINHQDTNGFSALHFAVQENRFEVAEILISNGVSIELKDSWGNTPLSTAIFYSKGNYKIIKLLLQNGANLDSVNNYDVSPRLLAESMEGFDVEVLKTKV